MRELREHLGHQLVGRAHLLDLRGRLADDHALRLRAAAAPIAGVDGGRHRRRPAGCRRSTRNVGRAPVVVDERLASARWYTFRRSRTTSIAVVDARCTSAPPHLLARASSSRPARVRAALAADPPRRQPPHQHVLRHHDVEHDQRRRVRRPCRSSASACATVRGKPSSTNPRARRPRRAAPATIPIITSSLTSRPASIAALRRAARARVPCLHRLAQDVAGRDLRHAARPREPLGLRALARPRRAEHHDVQPDGSRRAASPHLLPSPPADPRLLHEPVVVPHDQLRLDLLHGVHRHADDDQQRRAAEVERARPGRR